MVGRLFEAALYSCDLLQSTSVPIPACRKFTDYGPPFGKGDIIGCLIDRERNAISFARNGIFLGEAFKIPPDMSNVPLKPAVCGKAFHVKINTSSSMVYPIEGFLPLGMIDSNHTSSVFTRGGMK